MASLLENISLGNVLLLILPSILPVVLDVVVYGTCFLVSHRAKARVPWLKPSGVNHLPQTFQPMGSSYEK